MFSFFFFRLQLFSLSIEMINLQFAVLLCFRCWWWRIPSETLVKQHQATHLPHHVCNKFLLLCLRFTPHFLLPLHSLSLFFSLTASLTATASTNTSLAPCPGNQVMQVSGAGCGCPPGTVKRGDNCTCPVGFALDGAAECKGEANHVTEWCNKLVVKNKPGCFKMVKLEKCSGSRALF